LTVLAAALVYAQIVFGALLTHTGRIDLHLGGAVLVFAIVPIVTAPLRRTGDAVAAPVSRLLLVLLGAQLLLGVGSFLARFSPFWIPGEQLGGVALPVAHRLVGSLILAAIVILSVRVHTVNAEPERVDQAPRSHAASVSGHPRSEPASRTPLQQTRAAPLPSRVDQAPRSRVASLPGGVERAPRSRVASLSGHPRSEPVSRHPLQ